MKLSNLLFLLCGLTLFSASKNPPDLSGKWISEGETGKGIVEIYKRADGKYFGKYIKAFDEKKHQEIVDGLKKKGKKELLILRDFEYIGNNSWENGQIFSPNRKKLLTGKLKLTSDDELKVTGYLFGFSKTFTWERMP